MGQKIFTLAAKKARPETTTTITSKQRKVYKSHPITSRGRGAQPSPSHRHRTRTGRPGCNSTMGGAGRRYTGTHRNSIAQSAARSKRTGGLAKDWALRGRQFFTDLKSAYRATSFEYLLLSLRILGLFFFLCSCSRCSCGA